MGRVQRVRLADAGGGERFADRFEVRLAVVLHERLEEAHGEHFAFAFVDAGGQVLVDVVAEVVAVEERAAAVRLHEEFDGGVLLRFAAEDFGDDAFHFAAVAAVDQARAPGDERVAGDDQPGEFAEPALNQFARGDRCAVRAAESWPRE